MIATGMIEAIRRWQRRQETRRQLYALDARQLNDIGINRGDIEDIARGVRG